MQAQIDIGFDQLVKLAKQLPTIQWNQLKTEVEKHAEQTEGSSDLEQFLLSAPTFNKKQLDEIAKTRKAISQWRTK
jgi:ferritin-like metal-binding protein YciE